MPRYGSHLEIQLKEGDSLRMMVLEAANLLAEYILEIAEGAGGFDKISLGWEATSNQPYKKPEEPEKQTVSIPIPVFMHKRTKGLTSGENVGFQKGDKVKYRTRDGKEYSITLDSDYMANNGFFGYEALFPDGRFFAVDKGIYDWEGKPD